MSLFIILEYFDINIPTILLKLLKFPLNLFRSVLYIPSLQLIAIVFVSSVNGTNKDLDYGYVGSIATIIMASLLIIISVITENFITDIRHSNKKHNIWTKSSSAVEINLIYFRSFQLFFYFLKGTSNFLYHIILILASLILLRDILIKLPYYNQITTCIRSVQIFTFAIVNLIFILAEIFDNATITVLFNLVIQPILNYILIRKIRLNYMKIDGSFPHSVSQTEFELSNRHLLIQKDSENYDTVLNLFTDYSRKSKFKKNKLFVLYEAYYCLYMNEDLRTAKVKLTKLKNEPWTLEGEIQE